MIVGKVLLVLMMYFLVIHKNQEANHNINVKVTFETYFQLKFISTTYFHGYITRPWRYNTE